MQLERRQAAQPRRPQQDRYLEPCPGSLLPSRGRAAAPSGANRPITWSVTCARRAELNRCCSPRALHPPLRPARTTCASCRPALYPYDRHRRLAQAQARSGPRGNVSRVWSAETRWRCQGTPATDGRRACADTASRAHGLRADPCCQSRSAHIKNRSLLSPTVGSYEITS